MSKEELLISLLKSGQNIAELRKSKPNSIGIEKIKNKFNVLWNNLSKEEIKKIRKNFHKKEKANHRLKELEQKDSLKKQEERKKNNNITLKN